ncbi:MAG: hypothetical protein K0R39_1176 [Symbiobacteriaceae bacterium]|jgi:hypothetical protein|nr:hypothetical protein [Symbiobacteriaceae bacterium]
MTFAATLPASHWPLEVDSFLRITQKGLFAAPWLERPDPLEILAVQREAHAMAHSHAPAPGSAYHWTPALGHLLDLRNHCLLAAAALDPIPARHHYGEALKAAQAALKILHHETEGTPGALATWALGVHTLIQAQLAMPDLAEAERLARQAIITLSDIRDPLCIAAEYDAHAATRLAQEPDELRARLLALPDRINDQIAYYRHEGEQQAVRLQRAKVEVRRARFTATWLVALWCLLNLALMATVPLNGWLAPDVAWSLPCALAVPLLWWLTWDRPLRGKHRFFDWLRWLQVNAHNQLHETEVSLIDPVERFWEGSTHVLREARLDRELLAGYYLFILPSAVDTVDVAADLAADGKVILAQAQAQ